MKKLLWPGTPGKESGCAPALRIAFIALAILVLFGASLTTGAQGVTLLENEHADIGVEYEAETGKLLLHVHDEDHDAEYEPADVALIVRESARRALPEGTLFGNEGDPFWILPQSQEEESLLLGFSAEELPPEVFTGALQFSLLAAQGPGRFFAWQVDQGGSLDVRMNTADGIEASDTVFVSAGGHQHFNFGFTTNGIYRVTIQASARRAGEATNLVSEPATFEFRVLPLPFSPFRQWQDEIFGVDAAEQVKGSNADPDADGIANLLEYAFGLDPKVVSPRAGLPSIQVIERDGGRAVLLKFPRAARATDVRFTIEAAFSLNSPSWMPIFSGANHEFGGGAESAEWADPSPISSGPMRYYRLNIELP